MKGPTSTMSKEETLVAMTEIAAAAAIRTATAVTLSTKCPTLRQLQGSSKETLHNSINQASADFIDDLETNQSNARPAALASHHSQLNSRDSRETATGVDDSELGDPLIFSISSKIRPALCSRRHHSTKMVDRWRRRPQHYAPYTSSKTKWTNCHSASSSQRNSNPLLWSKKCTNTSGR